MVAGRRLESLIFDSQWESTADAFYPPSIVFGVLFTVSARVDNVFGRASRAELQRGHCGPRAV